MLPFVSRCKEIQMTYVPHVQPCAVICLHGSLGVSSQPRPLKLFLAVTLGNMFHSLSHMDEFHTDSIIVKPQSEKCGYNELSDVMKCGRDSL